MTPYVPETLPIASLDLARLFDLAGRANGALARYDGLLQSVVNPAIMLSPLTTQEAVLSSKIEGTQATVDEVLQYDAGVEFDDDLEKKYDIQEVVNYRTALTLGKEAVASGRSIGLSLMLQLHATLMDSVRGADKTPGEFRKTQNWIGFEGCTIEQATFVPPSPLQLQDHLEAFAQYLALDDGDPLVQTALAHAQFELLHPFNDGNGRIGRLLIPLVLNAKRALASPMFYLSEYLEAHRNDQYYPRLQAISREGDWTGWVEFFLRAIRDQAETNMTRVRTILELYEQMKQQIADLTRSQHAVRVLDALFDRPIFRSGDFVDRSGIPRNTAMPFLRSLRDAGILVELRAASGRRAAILAFRELLNCAEGREIL